MTLPTQRVLVVLMAHPNDDKYGLEIGLNAELASGTVHPILARLEACGWVESHWEDIDPSDEGRPRRRYYRLTSDGAEQARAVLSRARSSNWGWQPKPGLAGGTA